MCRVPMGIFLSVVLGACAANPPTSTPGATPTAAPTALPTSTLLPSAMPSAMPSATPAVVPSPSPTSALDPAVFQSLPPLPEPRYLHTATLLSDGRVLVVGGRFIKLGSEFEERLLADALLFDLATQRWTPAAPLHRPRYRHAAVGLPDGRVLVVGGRESRSFPGPAPTAEIYDPAADTWTVIQNVPIRPTTGVLLLDGRVLLVGYVEGGVANASSSTVFDPATGTFGPVKRVTGMSLEPAAVRLDDGRVLVAGGARGYGDGPPEPRAESALFDPATGRWTAAAAMHEPRLEESMALLPDGRALIVGSSAELFDPATTSWRVTGSPAAPHRPTNLVRLEDGTILAIGSIAGNIESRPIIERYDPALGEWSVVAPYLVIESQTATLLPDGRILMTGGFLECRFGQACEGQRVLADVLLFDPPGGP